MPDLHPEISSCKKGHTVPRRKRTGVCPQCHKEQTAKYRNKNPWSQLITSAYKRAKEKNIEIDIDSDWAKERYTGRCEITGIYFVPKRGSCGAHALSPSIDRIDQSKGYTKDNCRFILYCVNSFRGTMNDAEMAAIARRI